MTVPAMVRPASSDFWKAPLLVLRGQNSSRAVIKTHEDIITKTILQAVFLGQGLSKYISPIQRGQTANSCCSKYFYVVTVHPSGEMAIVLGTFTYSRWKICHIAYCYSKMLNRSDLFHWLPWRRMPKMCTFPQLVSDPFNPSRNKKIRVQPYCFIFLLSSFFLLGSFYFSFAFPLLVWFLSLSGLRKTLPFGHPLSHSRMQWRQIVLSMVRL